MVTRHIRESQTQPIIYTIRRVGGDPINLTGLKVSVNLRAQEGEGNTTSYNTVDHPTKIVVSNGAAGQVSLTLDQLTAGNSPYLLHFWVYHTGTNREPCPPEDTEFVAVHPNYE